MPDERRLNSADRRALAEELEGPAFVQLMRARLLELALSDDHRVALQATERLLSGAPTGSHYANHFFGMSVEEIQEIKERAVQYIKDSRDGGGSGATG